MANFLLPHFGEVNPEQLEEYTDVLIQFNGHEVQIDLNFQKNSVELKRLELVKNLIENLEAYDRRNKKYIEADYSNEDCDTVRTYAEHHLEELGKENLSGLIDFDNKAIHPEKQLVRALHLIRVGLYPDSEEPFAMFDYSIGPELTQYLVVLNTNENGKLVYMTMES